MKVCLDAGHGKETGGKRSFDASFFEYEFNRDVTNRLATILRSHGLEVVLTAPTDRDTSLQERCAISNKEKCDLFISIHANAYGTDWNDANGWEIFTLPDAIGGRKLAESINAYTKDLGLKNRGIKTANFYVLKNTYAPAVLIEHFFYTNKSELANCNTDEFRQKCAIADAKGILDYLGIAYFTTSNPVVSSKPTNVQILKQKLGLADETIQYLLAYPYGEQLIERIVTNLK